MFVMTHKYHFIQYKIITVHEIWALRSQCSGCVTLVAPLAPEFDSGGSEFQR
jgi:hypothetical protein